jgi:hypothetical protein
MTSVKVILNISTTTMLFQTNISPDPVYADFKIQ